MHVWTGTQHAGGREQKEWKVYFRGTVASRSGGYDQGQAVGDFGRQRGAMRIFTQQSNNASIVIER